jgi:outer membrane protein TolC
MRIKMKKILWCLIALCNAGIVFPQMTDSLSLEDCFSRAALHYTGNRQIKPLSEASAYRLRNYNTRWLPAIGLNGQATYQSETVQMSSYNPLTGQTSTLELPLDQYKIQAEISQQIYDGGMTRVQKEIERNSLMIDRQQVEIDYQSFRQQVVQVYFSVILAEKNTQTLSVGLEELRERKATIESGLANGVLIQENLDAISAEELNLEQKIAEVKYLRTALAHHLSVLLDTTLAESTLFRIPASPGLKNENIRRPEYVWFDLQKQQLSDNRKLLSVMDRPRISAFSQVGYGRPGFDFLNEDLHDFYLIGIGLKWNFIKYGETKRQKKILDLNREIIDIKRDSFDEKLAVMLENEKQNIEKYTDMIEKDKTIVELRKSVTRSSYARLENGTITPTDFLTNANAEIQAKLQLENHEILLLQTIYTYLLIKGDI